MKDTLGSGSPTGVKPVQYFINADKIRNIESCTFYFDRKYFVESHLYIKLTIIHIWYTGIWVFVIQGENSQKEGYLYA